MKPCQNKKCGVYDEESTTNCIFRLPVAVPVCQKYMSTPEPHYKEMWNKLKNWPPPSDFEDTDLIDIMFEIMKYRKEIRALEKSVQHYEVMRAWVRTRPKEGEKASADIMYSEIDQTWGPLFCDCCQEFNLSMRYSGDILCKKCPLFMKNEKCCRGYHYKMHEAKNWKEWLYWSGWVLAWIRFKLKKYRRMAKKGVE